MVQHGAGLGDERAVGQAERLPGGAPPRPAADVATRLGAPRRPDLPRTVRLTGPQHAGGPQLRLSVRLPSARAGQSGWQLQVQTQGPAGPGSGGEIVSLA